MKLHRLVLTNYRGVAHRELEFPDRGVVVVSGANEIGKSSMIEALDLLLEVKDRSTKREVKDVKPTHADVGAEVTAEISTGAYRFVYRKRFHKQAQTELTVLAPAREQLTGDEAHERVRAILEQTVDMELWRAQRIMQAQSTEAVTLSGSDALSRALDAAAGHAAALSGSEPLLVDRIDAEYRQYFTTTGRPTADWLTAAKRLEQAEADVARCQSAVREIDDAVVAHGALTERLARLSLDRAAAVRRQGAAQRAGDAVATVTERLVSARALSEAVAAACDAASAAVDTRTRLCADLEVRSARIEELDDAMRFAVAAEATARAVNAAAVEADADARTQLEGCDARVQAAREAAEATVQRDEFERLAARLVKVDVARTALGGCERAVAELAVSDKMIKALETAVAAVEHAGIRAESASARVEVVAVTDVTVQFAGQPVTIEPGAVYSAAVTTATDVELPGLLTVRVMPGEPAADSQAVLDAAREHLAGLLDRAGVPDVAAARLLHERRRELIAERDRLTATCEGLLGGDDLARLRVRLAELRGAVPAGCAGDAETARAELSASIAAHRGAVERAKVSRHAAEQAAASAVEKAALVTASSEKSSSAWAELARVTDELARERTAAGDQQLAATAAAAAERARLTLAQTEAIATELAGLEPAAVATELAEAARDAEAQATAYDDVGEQLRDLTAQLKVFGSEGRKGRLDAAEAEFEHAAAEHARLRRRSGAANLLRTVMTRHRDESRLRYVDPFRSELERLGRIVFGADFEVEIDAELKICSRTLDGRTVPYDSLSGGAKEQLGIVARLAGAALVAKEDGVPVVIDDALGFTDADRLARMGQVFDAVGGDGQVIVLTCSPERYAAVGDAHHVVLTG
jgi:uncharacterized protein YhaN